ncbi:MAG: hypothetical protein AAF335_02945, partial [Bacteroidota bacterium]
ATLIPNVQGAEEKSYFEIWFLFKEKQVKFKGNFQNPKPTDFFKVLISTKANIFALLEALEIDEKKDIKTINTKLREKFAFPIIKIKKSESGRNFSIGRKAIGSILDLSQTEGERKNIEDMINWLHKNPFKSGTKVKLYTEEEAKKRARKTYKDDTNCAIVDSSGNLIPQSDFIKDGDKDEEEDAARPWTNSEKFGLGIGITLTAAILAYGLFVMEKKGDSESSFEEIE